ncbi:Reducing polyketide synthase [Fusarium oxysporum f. sp. matthiolae]|nr:Reducing polyketide synthase [Fusarium oxysporum f. sp. matthiolae]
MTLSNGSNGANGTSNGHGAHPSANGFHNAANGGANNGTANGGVEHDASLPQVDGDISSAIAVIGVSGRFPGDATSPRHLWDLLKEGRNALSDVPESRFNIDGFYHPDGGRAGTLNTKQGYFLKSDVDKFDAGFFSITPEEARGMDPTQRILLELAYEGLENAGLKIDEVANQHMSCYIGACQHDYWDLQAYDMDSAPKYTATGTGTALLSNRISWFFNLKGPSVTIDTACSSTLTALHLAGQSIRNGESDSALVGGLGLHLLPNFGVFMSSMSFLSADNKCHSFDASANGYARAEGGGFVVLKRLDKALSDGDTIRAVLRSTGSNQDGRTLGITQPSASRQEELIRATYASADLSFEKTNFFEAHGTGTKVGDPIECSVIGNVFGKTREKPVYVGSVKSNIGHLEGASGLAGLVKTIYSLESGVISPTYGLENVNPKIKLDEWKINIPTEEIKWPAGLRRASINSFGYGGANAHAVLDDAYHFLKTHNLKGHHNTKVEGVLTTGLIGNGSQDASDKTDKKSHLFLLSSHEESSIARLSQTLQAYLAEPAARELPEDQFLHRLAYTLSEKRSSLPWKTYAAASTIEELQQALDGAPTKAARVPRPQALTFIFTGQGAQWFAMGRELQKYPVFQQSLHACSQYLKDFGSTWDLVEELNRDAKESIIDLPHVSQPSCTALQLSIIDLLASWGIHPQVTIGHSSGEIAAAYAKGAFDKEAAMRIAYFRGHLTGNITKTGSMAAVGLGPERVSEYLSRVTAGKIVIACINSPASVTLSGDVEGIDEVLTFLQADDIFARKLRVTTAYHSHHMQQISEEYLNSLSGKWELKPGNPKVRMFSSVSAKPIDGTELGPAYWVANLVSPVNFSGAVTAAANAGALGKRKASGKKGSADTMVEIGPHAALQGPLKQILDSIGDKGASPKYFSAIKRKQDAIQTTLEVVGELLVLGHPVNVPLANAYTETTSALVDLPPYAWNTTNSYWHESAAVTAYKQRKHPRLELLGVRDPRSTKAEPAWHNYLRISEQPWIEHHQFQNTNIYPMAGMIVMAIEGLRQVETRTDVEGYTIRDVNIGSALVVPLDQTVETRLQLTPWRSGPNVSWSHWTEFTVSSRNESGSWTTNCTGLVSTSYKHETNSTFLDEEAAANALLNQEYKDISQSDLPSVDPTVFYTKLDESGFSLGPAFRGVKQLNLFDHKAHFSMEVIDTKEFYPKKWEPAHLIHPAVLDVFVHLLISSTGDAAEIKARVPFSTASLYISADFDSTSGTKYHGFSTSKKHGATNMLSDVIAFAENGTKPLIALKGCKTVPLRGASDSSSGDGQSLGHVPVVPKKVVDIEISYAVTLEQLLKGTDLASKLGSYLSLLGQKRPGLSVLEYSSSTSSTLLKALTVQAEELQGSIASATLTTPLDGPVDEEASVPGAWKNKIQQEKLDLAQDPSSQGYEDATFDVIFLDVEEQQGDISLILKNAKKILKPSGILLIANHAAAISTDLFSSTGFTSTPVSDLIIARHKPETEPSVRRVLIVTPSSPSSGLSQLVAQAESDLTSQGYEVAKTDFTNIPEQTTPFLTLSTLDIDTPFLENFDHETFTKLRSLFLASRGTLWLTLDTASRGLINGLGRTIRAEHPDISFTTLGLDASTSLDSALNTKTISTIVENISRKTFGETSDSEYVIRNNQVLVERLIPNPDLKALLDSSKTGNNLSAVKLPLKQVTKPLQLSIRDPGLLDTLEYLSVPDLSEPLGDTQIEIEVGSVGLNFRDVMVAMGQMEDSTLGIECAGVVAKVGAGVQKFKVGDRVFGMHAGCFQTRVRVDPRTFQRTPDHLGDEEAASLMCTSATVVHSLIDVARLQRGESVLIHSAAGGVGQTAIRLAKYLGAEIFATVSSEKKKRLLIEEYGIKESHIFNSRDYSFADGILRLTNQRGVDVVINSLAGEALRRTWLCVAPFGRFIELGKRDIYDNSGLDMRPFLDNITFSGLDILTQVISYPDRFEAIGNQVVELLSKNAISPLNNLARYSFGEVSKAFRLMQSGGHVGKIVLYPRPDDIVPVVPEGLESFCLPHDATYVLIGGLGGIGRSVTRLLVERGARHLVFLSRSAASRPEAQALLDELHAQGVQAKAFAVDVAEKSQLEPVINDVKQSFPAIKGLIHCAMDLRDAVYSNMTADDWNASLRPKLLATRNLHELLPTDLDFFICLSSIAGIIGSRGQANYNAGNTYQDALAHHRAASGLAATSINLSLVVGIGVSTERSEVFQLLKDGGLLGMDENDVLNVIKAAISGRTPTQVALGASTGGQLDKLAANDPYWFADSRFAVLNQLDRQGTGATAGGQDWKKLLAAAASPDEVYEIVLQQLLEGVSKIIKADVEDMDSRKSLPALGIDSLVAIEIRTWLLKEFQADLSVFDIVSNDPLTGFAKKVMAKSALIA